MVGEEMFEHKETLVQDKDNLEILSNELSQLPQVVNELIASYAVDASWVLNKSIFFAGMDCTIRQILFLVEHAGPLDQFRFLVKKVIESEKSANEARKKTNPNAKEKYSLIDDVFVIGSQSGTLMQCLVILMDQTMRVRCDQRYVETDKGLVDCFIEIIEETLGHKLPVVLEQARLATILSPDRYLEVLKDVVLFQKNQQPNQVAKIKSEMESGNLDVFKMFAEAFVEDDAKKNEETIDAFKKTIEDQQAPLINNLSLYYANLLQLIDGMCSLMQQKDGTLSGNQWSNFCFKAISILRESINSAVIKQVFDVFLKDNQASQAIEILNQFDEKTKLFSINEKGYIKNNILYLNRLSLLSKAFDALYLWNQELLPPYCDGDGVEINRFRVQIIGGIQSRLPLRIGQIFNYKRIASYGGLFSFFSAGGGPAALSRDLTWIMKDYKTIYRSKKGYRQFLYDFTPLIPSMICDNTIKLYNALNSTVEDLFLYVDEQDRIFYEYEGYHYLLEEEEGSLSKSIKELRLKSEYANEEVDLSTTDLLDQILAITAERGHTCREHEVSLGKNLYYDGFGEDKYGRIHLSTPYAAEGIAADMIRFLLQVISTEHQAYSRGASKAIYNECDFSSIGLRRM